jgi:hypothetical protein
VRLADAVVLEGPQHLLGVELTDMVNPREGARAFLQGAGGKRLYLIAECELA